MMDDDGYKDAGKIVRLGYDEDHMSVHILIEGAGWGQGFGGLAFASKEERADFLLSVAKVFGKSDYVDLVDEPCVVLRCFGSHDDIEGLHSPRTGRTFTITAWRIRRGYPAPTPLQARLDRREREIAHLRRRLNEELNSSDRILTSYRAIDGGEAP